MQSTISSESPRLSATEVLASRYRHLFVLPSTPVLLLYAGAATLLLVISSRGLAGTYALAAALIVTVFSIAAVSSALFLADRKTIATFRRTTAVILAGEILWLFCVAFGLVFSWLSQSSRPLTNAYVFGAFACTGFEFLVVNGVFIGSRPLSFSLALLYPFSTLAIVRPEGLLGQADVLALTSGLAALAILASFPMALARTKTSRGFDALYLFRAFMKTWTAGKSSELEAAISAHSEESDVSTKVHRFTTPAGDIFLVLPGVHPGPFHPVGSYDLPGVISRAFQGRGQSMTLHRPGGHERNLATTGETLRFASGISEFAGTIPTSEGVAMRGPLQSRAGKATVGAVSFSNDLLFTVSFSPFGSDDLSAGLEEEMARLGAEAGMDACVVDAHNSIDHEQETPDLTEPGWRDLIARLGRDDARKFRCAYSRSTEAGFPASDDLTENGISLFMVEADGVRHVLLLADANNAVPALRGAVSEALESAGYKLLEFCTSDSHNLAARGLTVARGYRALGEKTDVGAIAKLAVDLARRADSRLSSCAYGSGKVVTRVKLFGARALDEFAAITQASSRLGRNYLKAATPLIGFLLLLSILF